jgi:hypothetical protein
MGQVRGVVDGPLAPYEVALRAQLARAGYAESSVRDVVRAMARLSGWLERTGRAAADLTPLVLEEFLGLAAGALHQRVGGPQGPGTGAAVPARCRGRP